MVRVIPAVAALDAEPAVIARAVAAFGPEDVVVLDVVGQRTTDAAVRADAVHQLRLRARHERQRQRLVGQRSGRARRRAFAARNASAGGHRLVEVEGDAGTVAFAGAADDLVGLHVVAGTDAAVAKDARLMIDGDDGGGEVKGPPSGGRKPPERLLRGLTPPAR